MSETAINCALHYLSRRAMTTSELVARLQKKGFSELEIQECVDRLKLWGYLDDRAYALAFSNAHLKREPRQKVYYKLMQKGIAPDIAEQAIAEVYSLERERELCRELAQKYWQAENERWLKKRKSVVVNRGYSPDQVLKARVGNKLWQKGFAKDIIYQCLEELHMSD